MKANPPERVWQSQENVPWNADKVAFVNDVFFCARDVVRLLRYDADLACGLDFWLSNLDFYDIWVARDATGGMLGVKPPYVGCVSNTNIARFVFTKKMSTVCVR